jgi:hypothetical protein
MNLKQVTKLRKSWAASIARNEYEFYTWLSGRDIQMKQIGLKNLRRTSKTDGC